MTAVAYLSLFVAAALVVFLITASQSKQPKDYMLITAMLMFNVVFGALLALDYLRVI